MDLKSRIVKSELISKNCGVCLYLLNSSIHFCSFNGGNVPVITFHSVIDTPEPVRRVTPPHNISIIRIPTPLISQMSTAFEDLCGKMFDMRRKVNCCEG